MGRERRIAKKDFSTSRVQARTNCTSKLSQKKSYLSPLAEESIISSPWVVICPSVGQQWPCRVPAGLPLPTLWVAIRLASCGAGSLSIWGWVCLVYPFPPPPANTKVLVKESLFTVMWRQAVFCVSVLEASLSGPVLRTQMCMPGCV